MKVRVRLIGQFMERFGFGEKELKVPSPCTTACLVSRLGMEGLDLVVTRNGLPLSPSDKLGDDDRVVIAPIFSGG
ncbi:MAG: MoaD/ThiS family protein [Elusimicrobia bacterium]|nr:MoaD/ThiS family protein [Elusimicrobiota bacterium]